MSRSAHRRGWRGVSKSRLAIAAAVAIAIGGAAYAFTASNTVPSTTAGSGSGVVSGYTISNIHYDLNTTTPINIDSLTFTVSPVIPTSSSGTVVVSAALSSGGPTRYDCSRNAAGETVTCATTTPQLTADRLAGLTVTAAQ